MRFRKFGHGGLVVVVLAAGGCAVAVGGSGAGGGGCNGDSEDDPVIITLCSSSRTAQRIGIAVAETNTDVFTCRSTSESSEPLEANAYFSAEPNHRLVFTESVVDVTVRVISDDEFVLWIRSDTGSFCNEAQGNSITRGAWRNGEYDVFIGSPTQGASVAYTLQTE